MQFRELGGKVPLGPHGTDAHGPRPSSVSGQSYVLWLYSINVLCVLFLLRPRREQTSLYSASSVRGRPTDQLGRFGKAACREEC